jgi:hypothetical protein
MGPSFHLIFYENAVLGGGSRSVATAAPTKRGPPAFSSAVVSLKKSWVTFMKIRVLVATPTVFFWEAWALVVRKKPTVRGDCCRHYAHRGYPFHFHLEKCPNPRAHFVGWMSFSVAGWLNPRMTTSGSQ